MLSSVRSHYSIRSPAQGSLAATIKASQVIRVVSDPPLRTQR
jgi:hypothetical protein